MEINKYGSYHKLYYEANKAKWQKHNKQYYEEHKEERNRYHKEYRIINKNKLQNHRKKYNGKYYMEKYKDKRILRIKKYKGQWIEIIKQKGMDYCSKCGYNKCFHALDYHHINSDNKKYNIGRLLIFPPTPKNIAELDKCICLCSNCHRELHAKG